MRTLLATSAVSSPRLLVSWLLGADLRTDKRGGSDHQRYGAQRDAQIVEGRTGLRSIHAVRIVVSSGVSLDAPLFTMSQTYRVLEFPTVEEVETFQVRDHAGRLRWLMGGEMTDGLVLAQGREALARIAGAWRR